VGVPCYNEAGNLEKVTENVVKKLSEIFDDFEVILVDDGSSDDTGKIADKLAEMYPQVRVVHHEVNRGYGGAVKSGYYAARKELVCLYPGDGQFDISEITRMLPIMDKADIAATYRIDRRDPFHRKVNQFLYNKAIWFLFGIPLRDIDCGFKLMKSKIFKTIELETTGALIDAEFYFKCKRKGFTYIEAGVTHLPRTEGASTGAKIGVIFHAIYEIIKFWWKIRNYR
jgi:glycosyltransferase involved in cell wall biosynthesis